jgi:hypothetical protein
MSGKVAAILALHFNGRGSHVCGQEDVGTDIRDSFGRSAVGSGKETERIITLLHNQSSRKLLLWIACWFRLLCVTDCIPCYTTLHGVNTDHCCSNL